MLITLQSGEFGTYLLIAEDGQKHLIQSDWEFPGIATTFGWSSCRCGHTDGTVSCAHRTASEMIAEAAEFLDEHVGESVEDPGHSVEEHHAQNTDETPTSGR